MLSMIVSTLHVPFCPMASLITITMCLDEQIGFNNWEKVMTINNFLGWYPQKGKFEMECATNLKLGLDHKLHLQISNTSDLEL